MRESLTAVILVSIVRAADPVLNMLQIPKGPDLTTWYMPSLKELIYLYRDE